VIDDAERLVGILTEGDPLRRGEIGPERHRPPGSKSCGTWADGGRLHQDPRAEGYIDRGIV
jgi:hypothetical protein